MLILSLRKGDSLMIGDNVKVSLLDIRTHAVEARLGITAPKEMLIHRDDIVHIKEREQPENSETPVQ